MRYDIRDTKYGFTIAELLMVVVIIALIGGVGGGLYVGTYKKILVEKAARDFVLSAKYARVMAIEKQKPYKLQLDAINGGFSLTTSQWNEQNEQLESVIVRDLYCRPVVFEGEVGFEDVRIAPVGAEETFESGWNKQAEDEGQVITFSPNGSAQPAVIQIGDGKTHYAISISGATGKAKISFGTAENLAAGTVDLDAE
jgi:prepilin-type N-terminal cleavage/methylation domain-containing protein